MCRVVAMHAPQITAVRQLDHGLDWHTLFSALLVQGQPKLVLTNLRNGFSLFHDLSGYVWFRRNAITRALLTNESRAAGTVLRSSSPNRRANARASLFQKGKKSCWKNSPWRLIRRSEMSAFCAPCSRKKTLRRGTVSADTVIPSPGHGVPESQNRPSSLVTTTRSSPRMVTPPLD